jgi:hypothetical protein
VPDAIDSRLLGGDFFTGRIGREPVIAIVDRGDNVA